MTSVQPDWSTVVGNLRGAAGKAFEHEFKMSRADNWPKRLHHYTDTAGALGILQEQHLFMTHAGFLNDQTELRYFRVVLQQALVDAEAAGGFLRELAAAIREKMRNRPLPEVYVTCFCEKRDLLSQWRGYGAGRVAYLPEIRHGEVGRAVSGRVASCPVRPKEAIAPARKGHQRHG